MKSAQLALPFPLPSLATFSYFYVEPNNAALLDTLQQLVEPFIFIWGSPGAGRSHLLQAVCHAQAERALYLPFKESGSWTPEILQGLEQFDVICLDDLDKVVGDKNWEQALFHFYNRCRDQQKTIVVSAAVGPTELPIQLPDLQSRLSWGSVWQVHPLSETGQLVVLQQLAEQRGMTLATEVAQFILRRSQRDFAALIVALDKLDQASLVAQRRLTIPFVKTVLGF